MNEKVLTEALKNLDEEQVDFICSELKMSRDELFEKSEDELDDIYDAICDIEVEETCAAGDDDLNERGEMAVSIVDVLGDAIRISLGEDADK